MHGKKARRKQQHLLLHQRQQHQQVLSIVLWVLILIGALSTPLNYLCNWIVQFFLWATNWIGTLVQMLM